ncbi:ATP-binding protein [Pelagibacterium sp. 26DY04]|uniref:sensor histidine kinase n=1 Tax=Pelagibacterium sp. 26DY04 TaxID=2967130 RepID=UPI0028150946|nr:ATP-binding protein [Pelagibacterium sp. 26DY04]WMT88092.1 ATP-binding protein [Pelagibacterium sp. 26DY04]
MPTLAALVVTIASAASFLAFDMVRTEADLRDRAALIATLAATQISPEQLDALPQDTIAIPPALASDAHLAVSDSLGTVVFSTAPGSDPFSLADYIHAAAPLADGAGRISVFVPKGKILDNLILSHGWIIAALLTGLFLLFRDRGRNAGSVNNLNRLMLPAIEAVPYGLAHWREDGRLVCANPAFGRLLRLQSICTTPGTPYSAVSRTISGKISARPVLDVARQRVVEVERSDGTVIMLDERPCPSGGFVTIVTDITERKAADRMLSAIREEQKSLARRYHEEKIRAEASSRAKTSFLAHLSHDIRTPLNHIIGFADMIRLETFGPLGDPKYKSYVADIKRAGEKLLSSFAEILEYAELEGGRKALKREPVSLRDLLSGCSARFESRAARAGVRLEIAGEARGWLSADRHYLDRMLANLIDNALRFTPQGGLIRVAAWPAGDGVVLEVTDTGTGMTEEQMSRLSQPFALSDAAFARQHAGIGLGIAIARAIAEHSGGRLAIDSLEGIGTTVAISLPLARGGEIPQAPVAIMPDRAAA